MASRRKTVQGGGDLRQVVRTVQQLAAEVKALRRQVDLLSITERLDQLAARVAALEARDD